MPIITIEVVDLVVFFVLVTVAPWNGYRRFRTLKNAVDAGDPTARTRVYRTILIEKWALTGVIAAAWIALSRSAESIGLVAEFTGFAPGLLAGFALTALAIGALLKYARSVADSEQLRVKTRRAIAPLRAMVPHTSAEKRWFDRVSISAGITEEVAYRGFLFAFLAAVMPGAPAGVIIVLAGLVFGLGHAYQGVAGVVKTGSLGVVFGALYWMTGSLLAPMVLHVAIDLTSGWVGWQIICEGDPTEMAAPAAV